MTTEQAIKILNKIPLFDMPNVYELDEAIQMAIEALESQERQELIVGSYLIEEPNCSEKPNESDTIYRQDAIDAVCKACCIEDDYHKCDGYPETSTWCDELVALRALPSAQPSVSDCWGCNCPKMERSKEQKTFSEMVHLHDDETHEERTETHARDCVERQAAIDAVDVKCLHRGIVKALQEIIEDLPPAQPEDVIRITGRRKFVSKFDFDEDEPEQKVGEWVDEGDPLTLRCSKCGYRVARHNNTNFCPNCGDKKR